MNKFGDSPRVPSMKAFLTVLLMFVSSVCVAEVPNKAVEELDIREVTFRYQFDKNASGQQQRAGAYYLAIAAGGKSSDPDDAFMERFAGNKPRVKKHSECDLLAEKGVVDKKSGEKGLVFHTDAIKWVTETEVEVAGRYYEANQSASGNTYYLKKLDGKWKVLKDVMHWIK